MLNLRTNLTKILAKDRKNDKLQTHDKVHDCTICGDELCLYRQCARGKLGWRHLKRRKRSIYRTYRLMFFCGCSFKHYQRTAYHRKSRSHQGFWLVWGELFYLHNFTYFKRKSLFLGVFTHHHGLFVLWHFNYHRILAKFKGYKCRQTEGFELL